MVATGALGQMDFRILGPVEVVADGRPLNVGGIRQRALLAMLLLHANEVVSSGRLIEALWGEDAPATATKTLHVHVSRLRKDLGLPSDEGPGPRLLTRAPGYLLQLEPDRLDLGRFEALAARGRRALDEGDAAGAAELLREALSLWRGPALADLALEPMAAVAGERLEDQRLVALEDRIDADLECGRAAELTGELATLVDANPLRERLRAQHMLALYRSGRQADALSAYQETRRALVGELGLEPGPRLQELERRILAQDADLLGTRPRPRPSVLGPASRRRGPIVAVVAVAAAAVAIAVLALGGGGDDRDAEPADRARPLRVVGNTLMRIDARTGALEQVARVGKQPGSLLVMRGRAWVANHGDRTVSRVDLASGDVETIRGLPGVDRLAVTPLGGVFVSSFERFVWEIPEQTLTPRRVVAIKGHAEALAVGAGSLWIASPAGERGDGSDRVVRYDGTSSRITQRIRVGVTPLFLAFGYGKLWVSNYDGDTLSVIEPGRRSAKTIPVGDGPLGIAAGEGAIWVAHFGDQELWRLDPVTAKVVARIPIGAGPLSVAAGEGWVWVTNREDGTVLQIDPQTNRVKRKVDVQLAPFEVYPEDGAAYVTVQSEPYS